MQSNTTQLFRGSMFRIESVLVRVSKASDYLLLSASGIQVATQKILESMPKTLEPPKRLFVDPVIVLDFQSLYPSIMIAYNLCFSTALGNISDLFSGDCEKRFGAVDNVKIVAFVRKHVREGIIPTILHEFLNTRIMIKKSQKLRRYANMQVLERMLENRQFGLKLFMNVMYGYAGASFSGRMPSVDLADAVVETARYVLDQVIAQINAHKEWRAEVVYGDTDSVFVHLKGRNVREAFELGLQMEREISARYPYPMYLKFEKVYESLILVSKKRYTGMRVNADANSYKPNVSKSVLETKGLEIVRRDGCGAIVKMMQRAVQELFRSKNLSTVKGYLQRQWAKVIGQQINLGDFVIAKEVKLGRYTATAYPPAHAIVGEKLAASDPMRRPRYGERVKYFVVERGNGAGPASKQPKVRDLVLSVNEFVSSTHTLNAQYYLKRQINNALARVLVTFDVRVQDWLTSVPANLGPKPQILQQQQQPKQPAFMQKLRQANDAAGTATNMKNEPFASLHKYFRVNVCLLCLSRSATQICNTCLQDGNAITVPLLLQYRVNFMQRALQNLLDVCSSCARLPLADSQQEREHEDTHSKQDHIIEEENQDQDQDQDQSETQDQDQDRGKHLSPTAIQKDQAPNQVGSLAYDSVPCIDYNCPTFYQRFQVGRELRALLPLYNKYLKAVKF